MFLEFCTNLLQKMEFDMRLYAITVATATALGFIGGFTSSGLTAQAGITDPQTSVVEFNLSAAQQTSFMTSLDNRGCPKVDTALSLEAPNLCTALANFKAASISVEDDGTYRVSARFRVPGTWVAGSGQ
jgi:hypothetical protein